MDPRISVKQAAAYANVCPRTVYRWIDSGVLPARRFGPRALRIDPADLVALGEVI